MKNLLPRVLSGIVYILLIYFGTTGNQYLFAGLMGLFMLFCYIEFIRITGLTDKMYLVFSFIGLGAVFYFYTLYLFKQHSIFVPESLSFAGPVLFILACITIMFSSGEMESEFGKATIAVAYTAIPFSLALTLPKIHYSMGKEVITKEILFIFILIWISDIMAYVVGSLWGKHKLAPKISGGKTWEGAVGGFVFTVLTGLILHRYFQDESYMNLFVLGVIVAFTAPVGDLIESKLKRTFSVKDSGNLIPGHGGFLDRLDSFIFVIPMVFLCHLLISVL